MKKCDRCKETKADIEIGSESLCAKCWLTFNKPKKRRVRHESV